MEGLGSVVSVDHGHRCSDGSSHISICFKPLPTVVGIHGGRGGGDLKGKRGKGKGAGNVGNMGSAAHCSDGVASAPVDPWWHGQDPWVQPRSKRARGESLSVEQSDTVLQEAQKKAKAAVVNDDQPDAEALASLLQSALAEQSERLSMLHARKVNELTERWEERIEVLQASMAEERADTLRRMDLMQAAVRRELQKKGKG